MDRTNNAAKKADWVPPPQNNLETAVRLAREQACSLSADQLQWLGAQPETDDVWCVPVLEGKLRVNLLDGSVLTLAGEPVRPWWQVLTLHYLAVQSRLGDCEPEVTFADLPGGRTYWPVYQQRVIRRMCGTLRDSATFLAAAATLGGVPAGVGDAAIDFRMYPRVCFRTIWYDGDEELPPGAVLMLPSNIESYFSIEDIVVLSEQLVARLGGKDF